MKLSKTTILLIALGILIIAFANLSAAHSQQLSGQDQLADELAFARARLGKLQVDELEVRKSELQRQLAQTLKQVDAARVQLNQSLESIGASDSLLRIAAQCGVQVTSIGSSGISEADLDGLPVQVLILTAKVEGDVDDLIAFVSELNSSLPTGLVRSVDLNSTEVPERSSALVQVAIYNYQGR